MKTYIIAELPVRINVPGAFLHPNLAAFESPVPEDAYGLNVRLEACEAPAAEEEAVALRIQELDAARVHFTFSGAVRVRECRLHIGQDGFDAAFGVSDAPENPDEALLCMELFSTLREVFFYCLLLRGGISVHSASILYRGRAYLFSAPSGTGKSTHAAHWEEKGLARVFNGDVCCLSVRENAVVAHGLPWCGTSGRFVNDAAPVGGIFMLVRGAENRIEPLSGFEALWALMPRSFSPLHTQRGMRLGMAILEKIVLRAPVARLACTPDASAADAVRAYIEQKECEGS